MLKFREVKFNNMQSMLEKLIAGLFKATDQQQQTVTLATNLFNSGVLKIGIGNVVSTNFLYNQNNMFTFKI